MPKRPNPFVDYGPLQLKTHVGMKEIASGSMSGDMMKEVYERTQEKLFSAMQQRNGSDLNANHAQSRMHPIPQAAEVMQRSCDPRQMVLDRAGHLTCPHPSGFSEKPAAQQQMWHPGQSNMQCSGVLTHVADMKWGQAANYAPCRQTDGCRQFSSWMDCDRAAFRPHPPVASLPASGGQLCLDSNGHLTAPQQPSAMDCDAVFPPPALFSENGEREAKKCSTAGGGGAKGWGGFPFLSRAKRQAPHVSTHPVSAAMCQTCQHMPGAVCCQFCERRVCGGCGRQCHVCGHHFCPLCSRMDYDTSVERAFCLSCVG